MGKEAPEAFSRDEELILSTLAEQSAIGVENLRLYQTVKQYSRDLEHLYNDTPVMMHSIGSEGKLVNVNDYWLRVLGYERSEVLGRRSTDFLTEASRRYAVEVALPLFFDTGVVKDVEYQMVKKNGEVIDVLLSESADRNEDGTIVNTLAFLLDLTDRKRAEKLQRENIYLQEEIKTEHNFEEIIGQCQTLMKVLKATEIVASTDATVLIRGETGTGKELIARAVHNLSPKKDKPLVKVNCAALPSGLIESELFGHERGAFTGALSRKIGRFELADGGTIFLDEIGDLPLEMQTKLLRVLQEGEFERVGGTQTIKVDVRVIAATNRDLEKAMQEERFRSDLYYRLNVFPVSLPALRDRKEDIELLVKHFVRKWCTKIGRGIETIPQQALYALVSYSWPGNIRELENVIERAVILSQGPSLELGDWSPQAGGPSGPTPVATLDDAQREHIVEVLQLTGCKSSRC